MPFTLPQSIAVKLKSSFVKLIILHLIKSKIMNQGRNQATCVAHLLLASWRCSSYTVSGLSHILDLTILLNDGDTQGGVGWQSGQSGQSGQVTAQSETKDNQGQGELEGGRNRL